MPSVYANFLAVVLFDTAIDGVKVIVGALPPRGDSGAQGLGERCAISDLQGLLHTELYLNSSCDHDTVFVSYSLITLSSFSIPLSSLHRCV